MTFVFSTNCLGSAFTARKRHSQIEISSRVQKVAFGNGAAGEDLETLDEMSDEEIEFTNSFDPLNDTPPTAAPSRKKEVQSSIAIRDVKLPCVLG
jgi:hypothetical protein